MTKTAIFLIGVPGSGKTTWAQKYIDQGWAHVSTDRWIESAADQQGKTYGQVFKDEMPAAQQQAQAILDRAIANGENIVWDQTNLTRQSRRRKIQRLKSNGYTVLAHAFEIDPAELARRQQVRASTTGKLIPQHIVDTMIQSYEAPAASEGFDKITVHR